MFSRRAILKAGGAGAAALAMRPWAAFAANAPGVTDTEIKIGQTMPYSGPASAYGVIGTRRGRLFQDDQRAGRRERAQDQFHQPRRRLQPAQDGRADPPPRRAGAGRVHLQQPGHRRPIPRSATISTRTRCRSSSSPPARASSAIPSISLDDGLATRTTRPRRASTPSISWRPSRTRKSPCSIRTTISARTI